MFGISVNAGASGIKIHPTLVAFGYEQWRSYTGAHWGTGPTVSLCGPTIKTFSLYHVIQLL